MKILKTLLNVFLLGSTAFFGCSDKETPAPNNSPSTGSTSTTTGTSTSTGTTNNSGTTGGSTTNLPTFTSNRGSHNNSCVLGETTHSLDYFDRYYYDYYDASRYVFKFQNTGQNETTDPSSWAATFEFRFYGEPIAGSYSVRALSTMTKIGANQVEIRVTRNDGTYYSINSGTVIVSKSSTSYLLTFNNILLEHNSYVSGGPKPIKNSTGDLIAP